MALESLILAALLGAGAREEVGRPQDAASVRFDSALEATGTEADPIRRARARVEILFRAGDLPGALREASEGLRTAPADRILLRRAVELETALRIPHRAAEHVEALRQAIARDALGPEERRAWDALALGLAGEVEALGAHDRRMRAAAIRARWVAVVLLAGLLGAIAVLPAVRRRPRSSTTPPASG
jgi:hypothetical protein